MFITNFKSVLNHDIVMVNEPIKKHLESMGHCPISYNEEKDLWIFQKTKDVLVAINSNEGGAYG